MLLTGGPKFVKGINIDWGTDEGNCTGKPGGNSIPVNMLLVSRWGISGRCGIDIGPGYNASVIIGFRPYSVGGGNGGLIFGRRPGFVLPPVSIDIWGLRGIDSEFISSWSAISCSWFLCLALKIKIQKFSYDYSFYLHCVINLVTCALNKQWRLF